MSADVKRRPKRAGPKRSGTAKPEAEPLPGLSSRRAAASAVAEVLRAGTPLDERLAEEAGTGRDPLARAIAVTTFRRLGTILDILADRLAKGMPDDPRLAAILTTGVAQILYLDIPDHAAVSLSVEVARTDSRLRHAAGLVNAILRRVIRERDTLVEPPPLADVPERMAQRWIAFYGEARAQGSAAIHRLGAAIDVTARRDRDGWAATLGGTILPTGSIRIADRTTPVPDLPGFAEGAWWVQDAAAAIPARLLRIKPAERALDLCAAPGGKTAQLANAGATVTAVDRSESRLRRLRVNLKRLKLEAEIVQADALTFEAEPFDAVLLDAPCTATGTIRRHPEIAWTKGERDLAGLLDLQRRLLDRAAALVRPGGRLVYCVCSLEREEGEDQAAAFLERHPGFRRVPIDAGEIGLDDAITPEGDLRTLPDSLGPAVGHATAGSEEAGEGPPAAMPGIDGFFAARFSRGNIAAG